MYLLTENTIKQIKYNLMVDSKVGFHFYFEHPKILI